MGTVYSVSDGLHSIYDLRSALCGTLGIDMLNYLDAHAAFVNWLDGAAECDPTAEQVEQAMFALAARAASRGMTGEHWLFVVDGLIAHAKRRCPQNEDLPSFVARGFDFSNRWPSIQSEASGPN